jgi:hypothetical protein
MTWATLIPIIAQYGLPVAEALYKKWAANGVPTQTDFDELRILLQQKAVDKMKERLVLAGFQLDDPKALALISLVQ